MRLACIKGREREEEVSTYLDVFTSFARSPRKGNAQLWVATVARHSTLVRADILIKCHDIYATNRLLIPICRITNDAKFGQGFSIIGILP